MEMAMTGREALAVNYINVDKDVLRNQPRIMNALLGSIIQYHPTDDPSRPQTVAKIEKRKNALIEWARTARPGLLNGTDKAPITTEDLKQVPAMKSKDMVQ